MNKVVEPKSYLKMGIIAGIFFGFFMSLFEWMNDGFKSFPFVSGIIMGLFFGTAMAFAAKYLKKRLSNEKKET